MRLSFIIKVNLSLIESWISIRDNKNAGSVWFVVIWNWYLAAIRICSASFNHKEFIFSGLDVNLSVQFSTQPHFSRVDI